MGYQGRRKAPSPHPPLPRPLRDGSFKGRYLEKDEGFSVGAAACPRPGSPLTTFSLGNHRACPRGQGEAAAPTDSQIPTPERGGEVDVGRGIRINLRTDEIKKEEEKPERGPSNSPVPQIVGLAFPVGNHVGKGFTPFPRHPSRDIRRRFFHHAIALPRENQAS